MADRLKETEVAEGVVNWFHEAGWEVYQEVQVERHGGVADIVAVLDRRVWVVECKTTLSLAVIDQAYKWQDTAHWTSVAVPAPAKRKGMWPGSHSRTQIAYRVLADYGIGLFDVRRERFKNDLVCKLDVKPQMRRVPGRNNLRFMARDIRNLLDGLCEEHKTFAKAGNADGKRWTPWKHTLHQVKVAVEKSPGISMKELIDQEGSFHYHSCSSARSSLSYWLREGKIPGVRTEREGKKLALYPEAKDES